MVQLSHDHHFGTHHDYKGQADWLPAVRAVPTDRPWVWLTAGWRDMMAAPMISGSYGILAVVSSFMLLAWLGMNDMAYLILPLAGGFMLLGPIFAVGLYATSRELEASHHTPGMGQVITAYRQNATQLASIGVALLVVFMAWVRSAFLIFMLFFSADPPALDNLVEKMFFSDVTLPFLIVGTAVGGIMAAAVFAISVVSIPMLLDRDVDAFTAMATSIRVCRENPRSMMVWAALIALFTAAGMATGFIGLVITFPLIGHASWHAYRDLVENADQ